MSWGIVAGAAIGTIGSGIAAGDSADAQVDAANSTNATNRYIFDQQTALQEPFRATGVTANNRLAEMMGLSGNPSAAGYGSLAQNFGADQFQEDPGYQFRLSEGMKGVEGSAAARGGLLSGAALKAIQKYGQGIASQEYGNAYQRYTGDQTNNYNRLAGLVNTGQGAANQISNAAGQYGQNVANTNAAIGNAQAAGSIAQGNALTTGIGQAINGYQQNQLMQAIQRPSSGGYQDRYIGNTSYTL